MNALTASQKLNGLDHLRALAITLVFVFHYSLLFPHPGWLETVGKFGWTGVDLFFVLSGYLISSQLFASIAQGKKISFPIFFIKRFFRIVPAYWLILVIYFCFPMLREREHLSPLWKYLTFTMNLGLDLSNQGTFSHAWSLCIEEQFYLLLPLILISMVYFNINKKGWVLLIGLFIAGFVIRYMIYQQSIMPLQEQPTFAVQWYKSIYYPTYCRLDGLLVGVSIAALFHFLPAVKQRLMRYGNALFLLSLLVLTAAYFVCEDERSFVATVIGFPLVDIGYGLMVMSVICPSCFLYKFSSRIALSIATFSYAVYLTHKMVIHSTQIQFSKLGIEEDSNWMLTINMATCLLVAWLVNKLVEKPFMKLRDILLRKLTLK